MIDIVINQYEYFSTLTNDKEAILPSRDSGTSSASMTPHVHRQGKVNEDAVFDSLKNNKGIKWARQNKILYSNILNR